MFILREEGRGGAGRDNNDRNLRVCVRMQTCSKLAIDLLQTCSKLSEHLHHTRTQLQQTYIKLATHVCARTLALVYTRLMSTLASTLLLVYTCLKSALCFELRRRSFVVYIGS